MYADDTTALLQDITSAKNFLTLTKHFSLCSGLNIKTDKTEALWIGRDAQNSEKPLGISWPDRPIKLLGLYIGHNERELEVSNFRHKINKMKQILHSWAHRDLTLYGRILIIKSLAISQFIYLGKLLTFPSHIIKEIDQLIFQFIWKGKCHKVKKRCDHTDGGKWRIKNGRHRCNIKI